MRGTRPLTRHGSLNQQSVAEFRYGLLPPMQETAEIVRHHRSDVSRLDASPGWMVTKPWLAPKRLIKSAVS